MLELKKAVDEKAVALKRHLKKATRGKPHLVREFRALKKTQRTNQRPAQSEDLAKRRIQ